MLCYSCVVRLPIVTREDARMIVLSQKLHLTSFICRLENKFFLSINSFIFKQFLSVKLIRLQEGGAVRNFVFLKLILLYLPNFVFRFTKMGYLTVIRLESALFLFTANKKKLFVCQKQIFFFIIVFSFKHFFSVKIY